MTAEQFEDALGDLLYSALEAGLTVEEIVSGIEVQTMAFQESCAENDDDF